MTQFSDLPDPPSRSPAACLDQTMVEVTVLLGATDLPLGKILAISRGAMLSLGTATATPLMLRINGRQIGTGHVMLDGNQVHFRIGSIGGEGPQWTH